MIFSLTSASLFYFYRSLFLSCQSLPDCFALAFSFASAIFCARWRSLSSAIAPASLLATTLARSSARVLASCCCIASRASSLSYSSPWMNSFLARFLIARIVLLYCGDCLDAIPLYIYPVFKKEKIKKKIKTDRRSGLLLFLNKKTSQVLYISNIRNSGAVYKSYKKASCHLIFNV